MKRAYIPTPSQLRRTRVEIIKRLYNKPLGLNLAYMAALFNVSKKTVVDMWKQIKAEREAGNGETNS